MCIRKATEPHRVPCGTPALMWHHSDVCWPTLVLCCRRHRNEVSHLMRKLGRPREASFHSMMEWPTLSKDLEKSIIETLIILPGESSTLCQEWTSSTSEWTVELLGRLPNWYGSTTGMRESMIQSAMKLPRHLGRTGVSEIDLRCFSRMDGAGTFGTGQTSADVHSFGTKPSLMLLLNTAHRDPLRMPAYSLSTQLASDYARRKTVSVLQ